MPSHDEIVPREVEREFFGFYALLLCVVCSIAAMWFGWWLIVPLIGLLVWQVVRVIRAVKKY